jgi:orotidine-5'-phosphate decarboxylase
VAALDLLGAELLTVHAAGGGAMLRAALEAAGGRTRIAAVTVLTSLGRRDLAALGLGDPGEASERMARLALEAGCSALVCSPREVARLRALAGRRVTLVCPGVRPGAEVEGDDQARVATPAAALAAGADLLVVGRPITRAPDLAAAAGAITAEALAGANGSGA